MATKKKSKARSKKKSTAKKKTVSKKKAASRKKPAKKAGKKASKKKAAKKSTRKTSGRSAPSRSVASDDFDSHRFDMGSPASSAPAYTPTPSAPPMEQEEGGSIFKRLLIMVVLAGLIVGILYLSTRDDEEAPDGESMVVETVEDEDPGEDVTDGEDAADESAQADEAEAEPESDPVPETYTIARGDFSARIIAQKIWGEGSAENVARLQAANPNVDWTNLQLGQTLNVPR